MIIIPIGLQFASAAYKDDIQGFHSFPFDWMFATPKFVYEMLVLLLEEDISVDDLVRNHFFNCDKKVSLQVLEHYFISETGSSLYNSKYDVIFPEDEAVTEEAVLKYIIQFERLKHIILNSKEKLYFIYTSQSSLDVGNFTVDNRAVVKDVYTYLSKIYSLIGKYRNNNKYKLIVFDAIQNEPLELLDKNIVFRKLNRCSHWNLLLEQMRNHIYLFR